jgi:hypothetical protein
MASYYRKLPLSFLSLFATVSVLVSVRFSLWYSSVIDVCKNDAPVLVLAKHNGTRENLCYDTTYATILCGSRPL